MIRLHRNFTPLILRPAEVSRLTQEYKQTGANVWNIDDLKDALLELSYHKCAYCECDLSEESKYMEVEHFEDKKNNPDKVLDWDNLLPSCKRCNGSKSTHDVVSEPIVNPFKDEPKEHLKLRLYQFRGKTAVGKSTIDVVDLNHCVRAVSKRFDIGQKVQISVKEAIEKLERFNSNGSTKSRNKLLGHVQGLLAECQKAADYAATAASVLHSDIDFIELRNEMISLGLWTEELEAMHNESQEIAFDCT